jgi:hypothetical protein
MMSQRSPTLEGFRAAFRRPSLTLAEIAWRWSVGATGAALLGFAFFEYAASLPVTGFEERLLALRQPLLTLQVLSRILRTTVDRAMTATLVVALAVALIWIVAASVGRAATVRALLDYFRNSAGFSPFEQQDRVVALRPLIAINFWRLVSALASVLSLGAVVILSRFVSREQGLGPALAFFLIVLLAPLICMVWVQLNWVLSLACVFVLRDSDDALGAIAAAVSFLRERTGAVVAVGTWNALARIGVFGGAASLVSVLLAFVPVAPARAVAAGVLLVTLVYCAVVDWLYIARLGGYICIAEIPSSVISTIAELSTPPFNLLHVETGNPIETAVDASESILSDVPGITFEE